MPAITTKKIKKFQGEVNLPGDKSISHRSLIFASQIIGETKIKGLLEAEDVINTKCALEKLGVTIKKENDLYIVNGVGVGGLTEPTEIIDMGNSGTGVRLLMGLVASYDFETKFSGDESLSKRPMGRIIEPLEEMGVNFSFLSEHENKLPLVVKGTSEIFPISYELPVASAQVKSAILLAGLNTPGKTTVIEPVATRDHTEIIMQSIGVDLEIDKHKITINGNPYLKHENLEGEFTIPADPSSAAFIIAATIITPNSNVIVKNVCVNKHRIGFYKTLKEMEAKIEFTNERNINGEKIADIKAEYSKLQSVEVPAERAASMIDEYPILSVVAAFAKGTTKMHGLKELTVKESNRLTSTNEALKNCGVKSEIYKDSLFVTGSNSVLGGGNIKTNHDHRIAMSFYIMGLVAENPITIDDDSMIATSFPEFFDIIKQLSS